MLFHLLPLHRFLGSGPAGRQVAGGSSGFSGEFMGWRNFLPGRRDVKDVSSKVVKCNFLGRRLCFALIRGA